jgi:hypothetical protein
MTRREAAESMVLIFAVLALIVAGEAAAHALGIGR